jgi:hypothetical protein
MHATETEPPRFGRAENMNRTDDLALHGNWPIGIATAIVTVILCHLALLFLLAGVMGDLAALVIGIVQVVGEIGLFFVSIANPNWRRTLWSQRATVACITTLGVLACTAIVLFFAAALRSGA